MRHTLMAGIAAAALTGACEAAAAEPITLPPAPVGPPAPPRPPAATGSVVRAEIRRLPWALINADDYPAAAIRATEQGRVAVSLDVSPAGRVVACTVTSSSGSATLDDATCRLLTTRARFIPARDGKAHPISDVYETAVTWRLPKPEPEPAEGAAQPPAEQS